MKVWIYEGSLRIVEKSGVGQAVHHQEDMLRRTGIDVTKHNAPDVYAVHINTVFPDSVAAAILARLCGLRVVYYGHSTMEDFRGSFRLSDLAAPLFRRWIRFCYSLGDVIITPTEYSKRLLESYGIRKPIFALSNGVDTAKFAYSAARRAAFRKKYGLSEGRKAVLSVGHLIARKGILEYIELARSMPEVQFFWFGSTARSLMTPEIEDAIGAKPENLVMPGFVSQEELSEAYCGCDLFCFLSREETEGIVVLEALSSGIPVLVRDIPVYEGWLMDGRNVWKASDPESIRARTEGILTGKLPDLTAAGRRTAESRSIRNVGGELLMIYDKAFSCEERTEMA